MSKYDARASGRGILLVVAGPSGVGKGTMISGLLQRHPRVQWSVSCTTREPRPGEVEGRDYYFVSPTEFERMIAAGELLEWAIVHGADAYGTPRAPVEQALAAGRDMVLEIDYQGARSIRQALPEAVLVFVAPPSADALLSRLEGATLRTAGQLRHLRSARTEFQHIGMFQFLMSAMTQLGHRRPGSDLPGRASCLPRRRGLGALLAGWRSGCRERDHTAGRRIVVGVTGGIAAYRPGPGERAAQPGRPCAW